MHISAFLFVAISGEDVGVFGRSFAPPPVDLTLYDVHRTTNICMGTDQGLVAFPQSRFHGSRHIHSYV